MRHKKIKKVSFVLMSVLTMLISMTMVTFADSNSTQTVEPAEDTNTEYTIVYKDGSGNVAYQKFDYNNPTGRIYYAGNAGFEEKEGYYLVGWKIAGTEYEYGPGELIADVKDSLVENATVNPDNPDEQLIILEADWEYAEDEFIESYVILYMSNLGDFMEDPCYYQRIDFDSEEKFMNEKEAKEHEIVNDGYKLVAWNTKEDGTGETFLPGASVAEYKEFIIDNSVYYDEELDPEFELYAQWEKIEVLDDKDPNKGAELDKSPETNDTASLAGLIFSMIFMLTGMFIIIKKAY